MDPILCKALLGVADAVVSADACASAMAAIRAAEIQAEASRFAGWLTMVAGVGALVAGCIAYAGQLKAANIQVRMAERKEQIEQDVLISTFISEVIDVWVEVNSMANRVKTQGYTRDNILLTDGLSKSKKLCTSYPIIDWERKPFYNGLEEVLSTYRISLIPVISSAIMLDNIHGIARNITDDHKGLEKMEKDLLKNIVNLESHYKNFEQWISVTSKIYADIK